MHNVLVENMHLLCSKCCFYFVKDAVSKYQEVTNNLEFAKELQRSFMALSQDVSKGHVIHYRPTAEAESTKGFKLPAAQWVLFH